MTYSNYLRQAAARASIQLETLPPLVAPLPTLSTKSEVTFYDRVLPRNQREAGIDHLGWEERIAPRKSISELATKAILIAGGLVLAASFIREIFAFCGGV